MNTAEVDLDRLVDYEREYRSVVKRAQVTGDHMIGLCPFHDDSKNSFSVDLKTGRWHCFSEDIGGNYVDFVAKMNGISTKDAYKRIMEDYHVEMPEKKNLQRLAGAIQWSSTPSKKGSRWNSSGTHATSAMTKKEKTRPHT